MTVSEDRIREIVREEIDAHDARSVAFLVDRLGKGLESIPDSVDLSGHVGGAPVNVPESALPLAVGVLADGGDVVADAHVNSCSVEDGALTPSVGTTVQASVGQAGVRAGAVSTPVPAPARDGDAS